MKGDPGILTLSEITVDQSHHFAVLKYAFLCGSLCNSAGILVLEEEGPQWTTQIRRPRSFAMNRDNPRKQLTRTTEKPATSGRTILC
jgi:hypothetical protein